MPTGKIEKYMEISIKKAAFISAASKYSAIFLNLVFTAILARILSPEDYGIVAVTAVFTTFFSLFADMGIGAGIIQNKELSRNDVDGIFTFSVKTALVLSFIFALFSYPLSLFYRNPAYVPIGLLLSASLFFNTLNIVPNALLLKEKRFLSIGLRTVFICVLSGIAGIVLALYGMKYYALVWQALFNAFFIFLWNFISTRPRVVRTPGASGIGKIKGYSSFVFGFNIINYFARNSDNLTISRFLGTASLGYYDKAYKLMCYPVQNLTHVITPVLHPILSEHQNDKTYIYERYMRIVKILSLLGAFITAFCFFAGDEIILLLFGKKWAASVPCFKFMSVSIWAQMITSSSGSIFQSLGDTKRMFIVGLANSVLTVCSIVLGIMKSDINAVARNVGIVYNLHFFTTYITLIHFSFGMSFRMFLASFVPDFVTMGALFAGGFGVDVVFNRTGIMNAMEKCGIRFIALSAILLLLVLLFRQVKWPRANIHK